ncbi:MAG: coiled-coil domain-containing protein [Promethearchaeota archaeon]
MFYNNGTIFQTTFEQEINIPKLGENLADFLNHIKKVYEICNYSFDNYKKLIFETDEISIIVLKLGEDSNIALFFKKEEDKELKLTAIRRYITRIEDLIDMDKKEIILHKIISKEEELNDLQETIQIKEKMINDLREKLEIMDSIASEEEIKKITKELNQLEDEFIKLKQGIEHKNLEIAELKQEIEKEQKI